VAVTWSLRAGEVVMTLPADSDEGDLANTMTSAAANGARGSSGFGPYRLLQRLGEGGMGEVWLAEQQRPVRRQVAIKIVKAGMDTAQVVARFEAERQALAVMDHPAIAKVFDGGTTPEGRPYFAMEYVRGEAVTTYCDRQRLSIPERLELFIQLCDGVQHAHQKGIIHRDLKPSNVLVSVANDRPVPRIIDFGIAKAVSQPLTDRPLFTELGGFLGTPEYMSPEQAESTSVDVDTRSDVYSLGVLLYEILVGALPFDGVQLREGGLDAARRTIRETDPIRPSTRITRSGPGSTVTAEQRRTHPARLASVLRGDLDWITMKALEKDRTRRYQTANGLALDVRRHLNHEPVLAGPPTATYRVRKFVRRHRAGVAAATALVTLLLVFAGIMTVQAGRIARERDRANQEATTARQVSDFLAGLFKMSDPSEARGSTLTAREILARGAPQLEGGLRDQPHVQARLQATIGAVYTSLGLYGDAQPLLERALRTQKQLLGEDNPETLVTANDLANTYWYQRKYEAAESLYRAIVHQRDRVLGPDHPHTLKACYDLASLYALQKRWTEFEPLARDTLARQRRVLGSRHPDTLASLGNIGSAYYSQGRFTDAAPLAAEDLAATRQVLGEDHPSTLKAMHNLATVHDKLGRVREAETLLLQTVAAKRRVLGEEHPETYVSLLRLASVYVTQGRYREAESAALAAYNGYVKRLGSSHESTRQAVQLLGKLYAAAGQEDKAQQWRAKLQGK
jgi:serine/threonine protein kinase/tetratricopeptide (TPR) repeat protein